MPRAIIQNDLRVVFVMIIYMHRNPIINSNGEVEKAGCVVINGDGQILLVTNKSRDEWALPKGHAEAGDARRDGI